MDKFLPVGRFLLFLLQRQGKGPKRCAIELGIIGGLQATADAVHPSTGVLDLVQYLVRAPLANHQVLESAIAQDHTLLHPREGELITQLLHLGDTQTREDHLLNLYRKENMFEGLILQAMRMMLIEIPMENIPKNLHMSPKEHDLAIGNHHPAEHQDHLLGLGPGLLNCLQGADER